ncbi:(2,3-dihydroxybenzoyl)adenylate synthase [Paracoccus methylarcula]|uniref:(2,3-dihydroxybenzoyl)adenylate synthase n=1 Tax=Paracoccus methylarcula TaxID=72022 RepID=A0A3R7SDU8_9RHOB|nr:(2,3-dihydroxybenzoyl)adenylate synthase [Paracoccus methylarcula]RNF35948.1 (2,3-dihydroxybenzoyl)adenylate synthase [Paracoccus methylarcula]
MVEFTPWPEALADRYRELGYWIGRPLHHAVTRQAQERPKAIAVICGDRRIDYGELHRASSALAARLQAAGLRPGDTALVQLPNVAEFYMVFTALMKAGIVPLNALFTHRRTELSAYAEQIRPRLLIAAREHELFRDDRFAKELRRFSPDMLTLFHGELDTGHSLQHWLAGPVPQGFDETPTCPDSVAFFQLSGGSTGTPKLIPRTHDDYDYSIRESAAICGLTPETRYLCAMPAPHNYLMSSPGALGVFHAGGTVVLAANPDPAPCFDLIRRHRVTMAALVPSAVLLWLEAAERDNSALASLQLVQVGGASFAEATARRVPGTLGCTLQQVFGMAEGLVNYTRLDDPAERIFTTQGRPISPDDEVRVIGPDGHDLPDGKAGLLAVRGPYTFRGYYRSPEHNARSFDADGFYFTGDIVERTADGYLRVVGRVKDQINRGGEKIAAEEIEHLLQRHPAVHAAALVAMGDARLGERSCAFIVARDNIKAADLRRHLIAQGIAEYKLPDRVRFIEQMPLTPVGKTDKVRLREMLMREDIACA